MTPPVRNTVIYLINSYLFLNIIEVTNDITNRPTTLYEYRIISLLDILHYPAIHCTGGQTTEY
jgi:hypothetical protein